MRSIRQCVGCGKRAPQDELRRFTAQAESLTIDGSERAPGRGAYLHTMETCWRTFSVRRGPIRSLRATPSPEARQRLVAALASIAGS